MTAILIGILGLLVVLAVAYMFSNDKKHIDFKSVGIMLVFELVLAWFLLNTDIGLTIIDIISAGFEKLIDYAMEGVEFVLGDITTDYGGVFFINVALVIVFTSSILSILTHIKVLPYIIKYVGRALSKITGLPQVESFNAVNSIFFGQSEALLAIKGHIHRLNRNRLFIVSTSAIASVSAAIVASYMTMLDPQHVLVALPLNMFSALIIGSIISPVRKEENDEDVNVNQLIETDSFFDAISQGAIDGGKVAVTVAVMLMTYLGLLAMLNSIFVAIFGMDFTEMLGYLFTPIAFLMGVPWSESMEVGSIMGIKLTANEFVAITEAQPLLDKLSEKAVTIMSIYLISFSSFGSVGIIAGSVQPINQVQGKVVAGFGLKMLLASSMASFVSATVVGFFV